MSGRIECPSCDGVGQHFTGGCPIKCFLCLGAGRIKNASKTEIEAAFNDGFSAAKEGFSISHCPISLSGEERIEWKKGWHESTPQEE